ASGAGLPKKVKPTAASAGVEGISREDRHEHAIRYRQCGFRVWKWTPVGLLLVRSVRLSRSAMHLRKSSTATTRRPDRAQRNLKTSVRSWVPQCPQSRQATFDFTADLIQVRLNTGEGTPDVVTSMLG